MNSYRIMTLNMLTDSIYSFGKSRFSRRVKAINEMISVHAPDLVGVQELTPGMFRYLDTIFEDYALIGKQRHSVILDEYSAILYKKERFTVLKQDTFWLGPSPSQKGSRFTLSQFPRITTFALLCDRESGETFSFFNTHLDQNFSFIRNEQAQVLRDLVLRNQDGVFTVVTGDFNAIPDSEPLRIICSAGLKDTSDNALGSTLRGKIGSAIQKNRPIDHILISDRIESYSLTKIDGKYSGNWISDHYPLMIEIKV